jgi:hypothetical protein
VPCDPKWADSATNYLPGPWSFEADVPVVLFHQEDLLTDGEGAVTLRLPDCPSASSCLLRAWASGPGYTFGFAEANVNVLTESGKSVLDQIDAVSPLAESPSPGASARPPLD